MVFLFFFKYQFERRQNNKLRYDYLDWEFLSQVFLFVRRSETWTHFMREKFFSIFFYCFFHHNMKSQFQLNLFWETLSFSYYFKCFTGLHAGCWSVQRLFFFVVKKKFQRVINCWFSVDACAYFHRIHFKVYVYIFWI